MTSEQETPFKDIIQAVLFDEKKSKDPVSTKADLMKSGNFVHDLDKVLQKIIETIIEKQNEQVMMNSGLDRMFLQVKLEGVEKALKLKRSVPVGQLKQFKDLSVKVGGDVKTMVNHRTFEFCSF